MNFSSSFAYAVRLRVAAAFLSLFFALPAAAAVVVDAAWVRVDNALLKLDLEQLALLRTINIEGGTRAHAVDSRALRLWVLTADNRLRAWTLEGEPVIEQSLPFSLPETGAVRLETDDGSGALWLAAGDQLYAFDAEGNYRNSLALDGNTRGLATDSDSGMTWAATEHTLYRLDRSGTLLDNIRIPSAGGRVINAIALSPGGALQVGFTKELQPWSAEAEAGEILDLRNIDRKFSNLDTLGVDAEGMRWLSGKKNLYRIDANGTLLATAEPFRQGIVAEVAGNTDVPGIWALGNAGGLARLTPAGEIAARFYWPSPLRGLELSVDRIPPEVSFTAPEADAIVHPRSAFTLEFSDVGSGVDPASFMFTVNGEAAAFECQTEGASASCVPVAALAATPVEIIVTVEDFAGNVSAPATRAFRLDSDGDGHTDDIDVFPNDPTEWADLDGDGIGDNSDPDIDGDGHANENDAFPRDPAEWADTDGDGIGDNSDPDIDGDGHLNENDIFPFDPTEWADMDGDGIGDNSDPDRDGDSVPNDVDAFPNDPTEWSDLDGDGIGDNTDPDIDGDGYLNENDAFPLNPTEWADLDGDGVGDNSDYDRDGDGYRNDVDAFPNNRNEWSDLDGDGIGDNTDPDIDGDGHENPDDTFPEDPDEWQDTDGDGAGDNSDTDIDGDGVPNEDDAFPNDPEESSDIDGDGIGDNVDTDRDGDGHDNEDDAYPDDPNRWAIPIVTIYRPATLTTVGASPVTVTGEVNDPNAMLMVNGMHVENQNGLFTVDVSVTEGFNSIAVRAIDSHGAEVTASVIVTLDTTAPDISISSPEEGAIVRQPYVTVTGLVNDIVRGTIAEDQAVVTVNGVPASVSNRSFLVENVPLVEGENILTIEASDALGNIETRQRRVTYQPLSGRKIEIVSGQSQRGVIRSLLAQPLVVKLFDETGQPVADKVVVFRVTQGDGKLTEFAPQELIASAIDALDDRGLIATTNAEGLAQISFKLGSRAGQGNHKVTARAVGFSNEALFVASADPQPGDKISVIAGNNQRGATHSPLPGPFVVSVNDAGGNFVHGAPVRFEIIEGIEENARFQDGSTVFETTTDTDGRASAHLTLGREAGFDRYRVVAKLIGTEASAGFTGSALVAGDAGNTSITGTVLDNQDAPIEGVTLRIQNTTRQAVSGPDGKFKIENAPVGPVHLVADGSTSNREGEWPTLGFELTPVAGAENPLPRPVYLLPLNTSDEGSSAIVGEEDVTLTLPEVPGFALEVKAGSVTFPDGARSGRMSVTAVNTNKIPNPPPNGMQPQFIVTIQPVGAIFDPPARLTLPNVDGYSPGQEVEMFSYSHTLEEFLTVGWGTVSEDGATIRSNEYVGVVESGWHCGAAPSDDCCTCQTNNPCKYCPSDSCKPKIDPDRLKPNQAPDDCKDIYCDGSTEFANETAARKASKDKEGDCSTPFCNSETESIDTQNDAADLNKNSPNWECEKCEDESQVPDPDKKGACQDECGACVDGVCDIPEDNYDKPRSNQYPDDCRTLLCVDPDEFADETANLEDVPGDCATPFCNADTLSPDKENDPGDLPDTKNAECQKCEDMAAVADLNKNDLACQDECGICQDGTCQIDTDKQALEQASPTDCRTDMCGGGWEPDDGEEPAEHCNKCSNGVSVRDPEKDPEDNNLKDCRQPICSNEGGGIDYIADPNQKPEDPGFCLDPACDGMQPSSVVNDEDTPDDACKACKNGEVVNLDEAPWDINPDGFGIRVEAPLQIKSKANDFIKSIPGLSSVTLEEASLNGFYRQRDCCSDESGLIENGEKEFGNSLKLSLSLINQRIWPPPTVPNLSETFSYELFGELFEGKLIADAGLFLTGGVAFEGEVGRKINECAGKDCTYAEVSASVFLQPDLHIELVACFASTVTDEYCTGGKLTPAAIRIDAGGDIAYNKQCEGEFSSDLWFGQIVVSAGVDFNVPGFSGATVEWVVYEGYR